MIKHWLYHTINGVRSGIPLCCVSHWNNGNDGLNTHDPHMDEDGVQYIRCPTCIASRRAITIRENGVIFRWLVFN